MGCSLLIYIKKPFPLVDSIDLKGLELQKRDADCGLLSQVSQEVLISLFLYLISGYCAFLFTKLC